ncbi:MAG: hypothetical protein U0930_12870 [Pirellulales bacterium]
MAICALIQQLRMRSNRHFDNSTIVPGTTDGFAFDHLSFSITAVREPSAIAFLALAAPMIFFQRKRIEIQ